MLECLFCYQRFVDLDGELFDDVMKGVVDQSVVLAIPCGRSILFGNLYYQSQLCLVNVNVVSQRFDYKLDGISSRLNRGS